MATEEDPTRDRAHPVPQPRICVGCGWPLADDPGDVPGSGGRDAP